MCVDLLFIFDMMITACTADTSSVNIKIKIDDTINDFKSRMFI